MKRTIIVHCWDGMPDYCWYPWLAQELKLKRVSVEVPAMPETQAPKQALWVPKLCEVVGVPDEELVLVGHSVGCITILRYLESLDPGQRIAGVVLVAGFTDHLGFDELKNYFQTPIDWEKIKTHCDTFVAIFSDNDPFVPVSHADVFREQLGAQIIIKHAMDHFSGPIDNEESCRELPDARDAVETIYDNLGILSQG